MDYPCLMRTVQKGWYNMWKVSIYKCFSCDRLFGGWFYEIETPVYCDYKEITNKDKAMNILRKRYTTSSRIPTSVVELTISEKLYGMPEETFIEHAVELPPRASKKEVE